MAATGAAGEDSPTGIIPAPPEVGGAVTSFAGGPVVGGAFGSVFVAGKEERFRKRENTVEFSQSIRRREMKRSLTLKLGRGHGERVVHPDPHPLDEGEDDPPDDCGGRHGLGTRARRKDPPGRRSADDGVPRVLLLPDGAHGAVAAGEEAAPDGELPPHDGGPGGAVPERARDAGPGGGQPGALPEVPDASADGAEGEGPSHVLDDAVRTRVPVGYARAPHFRPRALSLLLAGSSVSFGSSNIIVM